jgi:hypothetical protein
MQHKRGVRVPPSPSVALASSRAGRGAAAPAMHALRVPSFGVHIFGVHTEANRGLEQMADGRERPGA